MNWSASITFYEIFKMFPYWFVVVFPFSQFVKMKKTITMKVIAIDFVILVF